MVVGNCGVSLSPWVSDRTPPPPLDLVFPGDVDSARFPSYGAYAAELERRPASINALPLIGHSTLRCAALDRLDRPATEAEIGTMRTLLRESLEAGAGGFSTGLF